MNPFNNRQSQQGAEERTQRGQPLEPLNIPSDAPPRPPRQQPPPPPHSSSSAYLSSPYDQYAGGSFAQYAAPPPGSSNGGPSNNRPGLNQPSVSFQEPYRSPLPRAPDSQESVSKKGTLMGERRGSAATGISDLPELSRSRSNVAANNRLLDPEAGFSGANPNFKRKKSLVRPDRERMDPSHRQWYYRNHAANMDAVDASGRQAGFSYMPSKTGHLPQHGAAPVGYDVNSFQGPGGGISGLGMGPSGPRTGLGQAPPQNIPPGGLGRPLPPGPGFGGGGGLGGAGGLRRGKSILGRDEDQVESSLNILKRGVSLRRSRSQSRKEVPRDLDESTSYRSKIAPGPVGPWMMYCYVLTICCPAPFLSVFGMKTPEQQRAWREKIGLVSIIALCMAFVGFITFGFTQAVCDTKQTRYYAGKIDTGSTVFHGYDYNFNSFFHPTNVGPFGANTPYNHTNPAYSDPWLTGSKDASMLFQKVGDKCTNFLNNTSGGGQPTRYFTCTVYQQNGNVYRTNNTWCHDTTVTANFLQPNYPLRKGQVSWDWKDVQDPARNLAVWKGAVIDFSRLNNLLPNVSRPALFTELSNRNAQYAGKDVSAMVLRSKQDDVFDCLEQIISVGYIDSMSIGCVASKVELYVSLVFIIGVVAIKFMMAVIFGWFLSWRLGNYANETYEERMKRAAEIEQWTDDIYRPAPAGYRPNAKKHRTLLPTTSRFSTYNWADSSNKSTPKAGQARTALSEKGGTRSPSSRPGPLSVTSPLGTPPGSPSLHGVRSSTSLAQAGRDFQSYSHGSRRSSFSNDVSGVHSGIMGACPFPLHDVVPQPPPDYQPFNFPLAHSICLVTAYSESFEGLRTTLDSLATTDYPNSHKLLLVIADGIVKGAGSEMSTPDICLSMMKDFVVPPEEVEGNSYVAIADGYKRHNMAKIYAGFYEYDDETVERSKQQRVPMILVAKCGTPMEADSAKPGNRGKRDSQVLLMAFMQKVMFDERMTLFDYEFFNSIWRVTGISPDHFEIVLMVDADTKVFPDSLSRMVACMVEDPEIMGLCGETKIANKAETWVTMIQVFEYYISHHQTKAFEACFGGVTCLPGCFSAYRIKAPKGPNGYWVPILANPDIVEHYSENVVDTLHKKNLLLLGEDRYLTTLMLKTFPKRKMMFVPQAVCKTIVPDTFRILLSQRRRWINSTVHNLFELVMVNDLCGTFCFSMRFVVFMELVGTLVLPAAIAFTLYVIAIAIKGPVVPTVPLVLLGIILGLPGLLIVVTSRKIAYVGWMLIYLLSLPIWNFAFPSYAFWHMDDFSWGATRIVQGDKKGSNHGDAEGKFDPTNIIMKRWAEFERERRWKSGTHSRDSTYDVVQRTGSPERSGSTRYSVVSSDTYHSNPSSLPTDAANRLLSGLGLGDRSSNGNGGSGGHGTQDGSESGHAKQVSGGARARLDSVPLLELPAPLGPDAGGKPRALAAGGVPGSVTVPRPRDLSPSTSNAASIAQRAPAPHHPYESYPFTSDEENRPMMGSPIGSPDLNDSSSNGGMPPRGLTSMSQSFYDPVRHGNVSSEQRYPGVVEAHFAQGFTAEPEEQESLPANAVGSSSQQHRSRPSRGFSLVDDGPVASPQGVRQVTRGARRMSSVNQGSQAPTSPSAASQSSAAPTNYASERGNGRFSRH